MIPEADASLSHRLDEDRLSLLPRETIATDAFTLLSTLRNHRGEELVAATAVLFAAVAERYGKSPHDLYQMGVKVLGLNEPFHDKTNQQIEAMRDYALLRINTRPAI